MLPADHTRVLDWFEINGRDLPWRRIRDPWWILVAEFMSQQTQVSRVIPAWERFLQQWPTASDCADAPLAEVITAWSGLGYNRRARDLHRTAVRIRDGFGGSVPDDLDALLSLPGIGPYTARAVLAFAHERDGVGVLDTNVARILARHGGSRLTPTVAQDRADRIVPTGSSWGWNQALLDIGAMRCRPRDPRCEECPLAATCRWFRAGRPEPDPAVGSAGVSGRQSTFEGSDRQGRGRLLDALRLGPVAAGHVAATMGWPDDADRAQRVAATLVTDGLAVVDEDAMFRLPG